MKPRFRWGFNYIVVGEGTTVKDILDAWEEARGYKAAVYGTHHGTLPVCEAPDHVLLPDVEYELVKQMGPEPVVDQHTLLVQIFSK